MRWFALVVLFVSADAYAQRSRKVDFHLALYGMTTFQGTLEVDGVREAPWHDRDLPRGIGGGARAGISVPYARAALQAEIVPINARGAEGRHRATSVSLWLAARYPFVISERVVVEPYLGGGAGVALYDTRANGTGTMLDGRALYAVLGCTTKMGKVGTFVEVGWRRFDVRGIRDERFSPPVRDLTEVSFNQGIARVGVEVDF
ncbi:MAG: hypothetical protein AAGE52_14740 [Myxococcota bacterium]